MSAVLEAIAWRATQDSGAIALSDDREQFSYASLHREIAKTASLLRDYCSGAGPIALLADNSAGWVVLDLALMMVGRPAVPLPWFLSEDQRARAIDNAGVEWLITDGGAEDGMPIEVAASSYRLEKVRTGVVELPFGTAKVTFTSGTTGAPKGVCLSKAAMEAVSASLVDAIGHDKAGVHLSVLPLAVLLENVAGLYSTLLVGGHCRVLPQEAIGFARPFQPDFVSLVDRLRTSGASTAIMVPEILRGVVSVMQRDRAALPDLKFLAVGGAKVSESILAGARELGLPVYQGYGLSEAASVVSLNTLDAERPGSVGRKLPHVELAVASDGELIITNPGYLGYVGGALASRTYPTGDIGRIDEDSYVYILGRKSNVLITGFGRNVSPEWIEDELIAQPEIHQAMVFGDGEPALAALIVPSSPSTTDGQLAMAIDAAHRKLPDYAKIRRWLKARPFTPQNGQLTVNGRLRRVVIYDAYGDAMNQILQRTTRHATFFDRLVAETEQQRDYLLSSEQLQRGLAGTILVDAYVAYLVEAYHHVRHTVPLLQLVKSRLPAGREWLSIHLNEYIAEESGHDEWILDDIRNAGGDAEAVRNGRPRMATEFMIAYAYDFVNRINPVGFFGMVFVLESTSTKLAIPAAEGLAKALGLSTDCFRYLMSHGSLDIEHMRLFESIMAHIDYEEDRNAIVHMAQRIYVLFANIFRAIPLEQNSRCDVF